MGVQMSLILPNLYLGSWPGAKNEKLLKENKIEHILTVFDLCVKFPDYIKSRNHLHISAHDNDSQNLRQYFQQSIDFIHMARIQNEGVLVHCMAGISRSTTLLIAYLMVISDMTWKQCWFAVKAARHDVHPNYNFQHQLQEFENKDLKTVKAAFWSTTKEWPSYTADLAELRRLLTNHEAYIRTGYWPGEPTLEKDKQGEFYVVHHDTETLSESQSNEEDQALNSTAAS